MPTSPDFVRCVTYLYAVMNMHMLRAADFIAMAHSERFFMQ